MIDKSEFSKRLQAVILEKKIKQNELAAVIGVTPRTVSRWMCDKGLPNDGKIREIAEKMGVSLLWLKTGTGEMFVSYCGDIMKIPQDIFETITILNPEVIDFETTGKKKYPAVKTYDDETSQLHFFCIHCNDWHHHGRGGKDAPYKKGRKQNYAGHRNTHCLAGNSPFHRNGVWLDIVGKYTEEIKKQHRPGKALMCPKCRHYYSAALNACACGYINKSRKSQFPEVAEIYQEFLRKPPSIPPATFSEKANNDARPSPVEIIEERRKRKSRWADNLDKLHEDLFKEISLLGLNDFIEVATLVKSLRNNNDLKKTSLGS